MTYPDGSTDDAKAKFKLDTDGDGKPDTEDPDDDGDGIPDEKEKEDDTNPKVPNQNLDYEPGYEDGSGKPGEDVKIDPPTFTGKDGKETKAPEGTKFTPGENAPDGVKIDESTGEITVTIPEDAKPGDKITVPVVVTYPDGSKDNVDVTVTVEQPKPDWGDSSTTPDEPVDVPNTGDPVEDGTKVETEGPGKADLNPETGTITVTPDKDAKPGDKIKVVVKDKDDKVIDEFIVEIKPYELSSRKGCTESLLGFGLPLLALIPLGIAAQSAIPGLQGFQAQLDQQVRDMNTALQRQLGILDPNMARAAAEFDARLKGCLLYTSDAADDTASV